MGEKSKSCDPDGMAGTHVKHCHVPLEAEIERLRAELSAIRAQAEASTEYVLVQINAELRAERDELRGLLREVHQSLTDCAAVERRDVHMHQEVWRRLEAAARTEPDSRSRQKRIAVQKGEPMPVHVGEKRARAAERQGHPEDDCDACGGSNITWSAPSKIWNAVMGGPQGIVCPQCFDRRAAAHGYLGLWRFEAAASDRNEQ